MYGHVTTTRNSAKLIAAYRLSALYVNCEERVTIHIVIRESFESRFSRAPASDDEAKRSRKIRYTVPCCPELS